MTQELLREMHDDCIQLMKKDTSLEMQGNSFEYKIKGRTFLIDNIKILQKNESWVVTQFDANEIIKHGTFYTPQAAVSYINKITK